MRYTKLGLIVLQFLWIDYAFARNPNFSTGVQLINKDTVPHKIEVKAYGLTAAVCEVRDGNSLGLKRGLDSALSRGNVKNFKILERRSEFPADTVSAEVEAKTTVNCLCVRGCEVKISGSSPVYIPTGKDAIIANGSVHGE
jgi:hypothetical protein